MPKVECPECLNVMSVASVAAPGGGNHKRKRSSVVCEGCGLEFEAESHVVPQATPEGPPPPSLRKKPNIGVVGRSNGAPSITTWPFTSMSNQIEYFDDLTTARWAARKNSHIRLVFNLLDVTKPKPQGIAIPLPQLSSSRALQEHFDAITQAMQDNKTKTSCTEAVGEAAAAMAVLAHFRDHKIASRFSPGPGIDQIWTSTGTDDALSEVLIVEAKGPNAVETGNLFMPPDFEQMGSNWIIHNLARMMSAAKNRPGSSDSDGLLAASITRGLGLKVGLVYPGYGGSSKGYFGAIAFDKSRKTIQLRRITVQADWQADGMLSYTLDEKPPLDDFTPQQHQIKTGLFGAVVPGRREPAPEITYP